MKITATRGFEIMNKVCDILTENGCPESLEVNLGAEMDINFSYLVANVLGK